MTLNFLLNFIIQCVNFFYEIIIKSLEIVHNNFIATRNVSKIYYKILRVAKNSDKIYISTN